MSNAMSRTAAPAPPAAARVSGLSRRRGFTLLELVVTIIVVTVLMAVAVLGYGAYVHQARQTAARANLIQLGRFALAEAARTDADLTRALIATAAGQLPGGVTPGWDAAGDSWDLLKSTEAPTGPRQLAVGFDNGAGTPTVDTGGTRAVVLTRAGGDDLLALQMTERGDMRVYAPPADAITPAASLEASGGTGSTSEPGAPGD